jgi:hypothetical protein
MAAKLSNVENFVLGKGATLMDTSTLTRHYLLGDYRIGLWCNERKYSKGNPLPLTCSHYTVAKKGDLPHQTKFIRNVHELKSHINSL